MKRTACFILLLLSVGLLSRCTPAKEEQGPYNLLFILTDEQRYDTSLPYGNELVKTPHLNQLGEEALVFEKAYVTQPVCSPARSSILTGRYPHQTTVTANNIPLPDSIPVLPALLSSTFPSWSRIHLILAPSMTRTIRRPLNWILPTEYIAEWQQTVGDTLSL